MADDFGSAPREQEVILAWFRKLNSSDRIALAATVFALISLVVSIKSCQHCKANWPIFCLADNLIAVPKFVV